MRLRLIIPVLRSPEAADYTARGVFVGLLVALTPTMGLQMVIVAGVWAMVRVLHPSWGFNVVIGMIWTWLTNVFTAPPIYYVFFITGEGMLGRWGETGGYALFQQRLVKLLQTDVTFLESLLIYVVGIFEAWGMPMMIGCVPWAIGGAFLGYWWSLRFIHRFQNRRQGQIIR